MKKILALMLFALLLLNGCNAANNKEQPSANSNIPVLEENANQSEPTSADSSPSNNVTFDDQKQVEQLITTYFNALEKKDYLAAWELTSSNQQDNYSKTQATDEHWGIETVKFISMQGWLPPSLSQASQAGEAPPNTPTILFLVKLDIKPSKGSAWDDGINERFIMVTKDNDDKWKIDGLTTSP